MEKHHEEFARLLGTAVGYAINNQVAPAVVIGMMEMVKHEVINMTNPTEEEAANDK